MKTTQFEMVFHIDMFAAILVESPFLAQNHCARWSTMKTNAGWRDGISSVYLFCMKNGADLISKHGWNMMKQSRSYGWLIQAYACLCCYTMLFDMF